MINPIILYSVGGAALFGAFAGWSVRDWKADADTLAAYARADKIRADMQSKIDNSSKTYEDWRYNADANTIETRNTVREIYRNVEVPSNCAAPDAIVSLLKERVAAVNATATGQPSTALPEDFGSSQPVD